MGITFEEFTILVKAMKAVYTDPKFLADYDATKTWYAMLNDLTYAELSKAVKAYMQTEVFPPTIAGIRAKVAEIQPEEENFNEAWGAVRKALKRSGYYWEEEYAKLPEPIRKAVGKAENLKEWSQMEASVVDGVIYSQFVKSYTGVQKRQGFVDRLSQDIAERLAIQAEQPKQIEQKHEERREVEITNFPPEIRSRLDRLYRRLGNE